MTAGPRRYAEVPGEDAEEPLAGGDVTEGVVRRGRTVRRPLGPHSPVVHAVLDHLEGVGFDGAPRFLGVDDAGREVLTFVEGEVAGRPWPAWVADEGRLVSLARLVRRLDDALAGLGVPEGLVPPAEEPPGIPQPLGPTPVILGHGDVTPENVVWRDGEAHALIDFDLTRPCAPLDEVLSVLLWWAPLMPEQDRPEVLRGVDAFARTRIVVDAYGLDADSRRELLPAALRMTDRSWHLMRHRAATLGGGWARMWDDGVGDRIRRRAAWLDAHAEQLRAALDEPR
ncbi:MAG: phosphotransferase [Kineosporiaceae bacterium]